jgi:hypothetical protein
VAREWDDLGAAERDSFGIEWSNQMSAFRELAHYAENDMLTEEQRRRYEISAVRLSKLRPLTEKLGLCHAPPSGGG